MRERTLICAKCKVILIVVRDGKVRKDTVVYCKCCDPGVEPEPEPEMDAPDFLAGLFGKRGRG